jgi:hypothetical protein
VNKLRLLKKLNDEGIFERLTSEELRLYLIMIAESGNNGEGELCLERLSGTLGRKVSPARLARVCAALEQKGLLTLTTPCCHGTGDSLRVSYRILCTNASS